MENSPGPATFHQSHRPRTSPVKSKGGFLEARSLRMSTAGGGGGGGRGKPPQTHLTLTGLSHPSTQSLPPNPEYYLPSHTLLPFPSTPRYSHPPNFTPSNLDALTSQDVLSRIDHSKGNLPVYKHFRNLKEFSVKRKQLNPNSSNYQFHQLQSSSYIFDSYRYSLPILHKIRLIWYQITCSNYYDGERLEKGRWLNFKYEVFKLLEVKTERGGFVRRRSSIKLPSETIDFSKVGDKKLAVTVYSLKSPNFMRVCGSRSACTISSMVGEKESKKKSTGCERIFKNGATFNHRSEVCFESEGSPDLNVSINILNDLGEISTFGTFKVDYKNFSKLHSNCWVGLKGRLGEVVGHIKVKLIYGENDYYGEREKEKIKEKNRREEERPNTSEGYGGRRNSNLAVSIYELDNFGKKEVVMAKMNAEFVFESNKKRSLTFYRFFLLMHSMMDLWSVVFLRRTSKGGGLNDRIAMLEEIEYRVGGREIQMDEDELSQKSLDFVPSSSKGVALRPKSVQSPRTGREEQGSQPRPSTTSNALPTHRVPSPEQTFIGSPRSPRSPTTPRASTAPGRGRGASMESFNDTGNSVSSWAQSSVNDTPHMKTDLTKSYVNRMLGDVVEEKESYVSERNGLGFGSLKISNNRISQAAESEKTDIQAVGFGVKAGRLEYMAPKWNGAVSEKKIVAKEKLTDSYEILPDTEWKFGTGSLHENESVGSLSFPDYNQFEDIVGKGVVGSNPKSGGVGEKLLRSNAKLGFQDVQASRFIYKIDSEDLREAQMFKSGFYDSLAAPNREDRLNREKPKKLWKLEVQKSRERKEKARRKIGYDMNKALARKYL